LSDDDESNSRVVSSGKLNMQVRLIVFLAEWAADPGMQNCERRAIIANEMPTQKSMVNEFAWDEAYRVSDIEDVLTPALIVYPKIVASNIERTVDLLNGEAGRWRVHIKTTKLAYTLRLLIERGVRNLKCATTLELWVACEAGASDVLVAHPSM